MSTVVHVALKSMLALLVLVTLAAQVFVLPEIAQSTANLYPDIAWLRLPMLVIAIVFVTCVQVALIATWRLLTMVGRDRIFQDRAFVLVDVIIGAILVAIALMIAAVVLLSTVGLGGPATLYLIAIAIAGAALALLVVVMRRLLRMATQLSHDLAEVV